jgi:hypothetical protein
MTDFDFNEEQVKAALIRSGGWNGGNATDLNRGNGWSCGVSNTHEKKISQTIKLSLTLLVIGLFFFQEILANTDPVPVFELKDTLKGQPNYIIKIYPDGKVHYHGYTVAVVGDRYAELTQTQTQLNEFIIYFLSLPFEESKITMMSTLVCI